MVNNKTENIQMKTSIDLITVGQLVEDLANFEEEYSGRDVAFWNESHEPCYPTSMKLDEDGDLCIYQDEDVENYFVGSLLEELGEYDEDVLVYVDARGQYLAIDGGEECFYEDVDEDSDIEIIACNTRLICNKKEEKESGADEVVRKNADPEAMALSDKIGCCAITLFLLCFVVYTILDAMGAGVSVWAIVFVMVGAFVVITLIDIVVHRVFRSKPPVWSVEHLMELMEKMNKK